MGPTRKRLRLPFYDYGQPGTTFVTACLLPRVPILGRVEGDSVVLTRLGAIVEEELVAAAGRFDEAGLDTYVVMPDHVHALIVVWRAGTSVSQVVSAFKSRSARRVNEVRRTPGMRLWQRGFHDHVVRDEEDLGRCREYIAANPARWTAHRARGLTP